MSWRDPPSADFDNDPTYRWPCWDIGLDEADLFGDFHERFNTAPLFIQDPRAFHSDVSDVAKSASSKEDFYARLQQRKDERLHELQSFILELASFRIQGFHSLDDAQEFTHFRLTRFATLDCLAAFLATFLTPNKYGKLPCEKKLIYAKNNLTTYEGQVLSAKCEPGSAPAAAAASRTPVASSTPTTTSVDENSSSARPARKRRRSVTLRDKETTPRSKRPRTSDSKSRLVEQEGNKRQAGGRRGTGDGDVIPTENEVTEEPSHVNKTATRRQPPSAPKRRSARLAGLQLSRQGVTMPDTCALLQL